MRAERDRKTPALVDDSLVAWLEAESLEVLPFLFSCV